MAPLITGVVSRVFGFEHFDALYGTVFFSHQLGLDHGRPPARGAETYFFTGQPVPGGVTGFGGCLGFFFSRLLRC